MKALQMIIACLGRLCLGAIFIMTGLNVVLNWNGSLQMFQNALCNWSYQAAALPIAEPLVNTLLLWLPTILIIAVVFLLLGGLLVFFGVKPRFGAFLLILFVLAQTLVYHSFWMAAPEDKSMQMALFMKNLAILGGLLILLAFGNGGSGKKSASQGSKGS